MHALQPRRLAVALTLALALSPLLLGADKEKKEVQIDGKVVPMKTVLDKEKIKIDADAAPHWLALVTDEGKVYPLLKDDGSRMFFVDATLQNRPMRLTGRLVGDGQLLQVFQVHSRVKDELREVFYWCDICSIKRFEKRACECCGAPMELREEKPRR